MRPLDIQQIGDELAVKWDNGTESYLKLEGLRRYCPCAGCKGEMDIMGNLYKGPDTQLSPAAFQLRRISNVGGYGVQPGGATATPAAFSPTNTSSASPKPLNSVHNQTSTSAV